MDSIPVTLVLKLLENSIQNAQQEIMEASADVTKNHMIEYRCGKKDALESFEKELKELLVRS